MAFVLCLTNPIINYVYIVIKYGKKIIILGGGGVKDVRAWQDDPKLNAEASLIIKIASEILQAIKEKDIKYSNDFMKFEGDLTFEID